MSDKNYSGIFGLSSFEPVSTFPHELITASFDLSKKIELYSAIGVSYFSKPVNFFKLPNLSVDNSTTMYYRLQHK